ncbi:unnamed protein product [Cochlearia groenlandica]
MKNISLTLSLLIFVLAITSNLGANARELTGVFDENILAGNSNEADNLYAGPACKRDIDCSFACPKGGFCNKTGHCDCF